MSETQIRIGGFGGQGVILSAIIIGRAAAIHGGLHATLVQSFGPEARGSASSAELIVSDQPINYPYVDDLDMLVVLSQDAYAKFSPQLKKGGLLVTDSDLVKVAPEGQQAHAGRHFTVPATRIAEEIGRKIVLNIVTVGFFGVVSRLMPIEALEKSVVESVPAGTRELNLKAFRRGWEAGLEAIARLAATRS
jgi:2-oxoglutarate ferredoxin oxidoreductase subunit gamma